NISVASWFSQITEASLDFTVEGRIAWVEVKGVLFKLWSGNTFSRIANKWGKLLDVDDQEDTCFHSKRLCIHTQLGTGIKEEFKAIHRGKVYWIRANETPGWVPDFTDDSGDEEDLEDNNSNDDLSDIRKADNTCKNSEGDEVPETIFEDDGSEDPFNIYPLLNKNKGANDKDMMIIVIYAPQDNREKQSLWEYLQQVISKWRGEIVEDIWKDSPCVGNNAISILMGKLRYLKRHIREWNKSYQEVKKQNKTQIKKDLEAIDLIINKGQGNEDVIRSHMECMNKLLNCNKLDSLEAAQKVKVKWAIEGDENSGFFHGIINKKRNIRSIRGVMVDGEWIDNPKNMDFPYQITLEPRNELESEVSNKEIKKAVWECGIDKAPGPDGFTFGFFRHLWYLIDKEVNDAVRYFFHNFDLPNGCNSSFIALIPKIPDASLVKDFRPISLIGGGRRGYVPRG
nr:RNA-directed DNA polymerase, eukaryota [Tanacetum cinerariifolium]